MDAENLKKQLIEDEGKRNDIYLDHLGYKTVGIGHLLTANDPSWLTSLEVGDTITDEQVEELLDKDLKVVYKDAMLSFYPEWDKFPTEAKEVLLNMIFNLGGPRFRLFKKTIAAAYEQKWDIVAKEMLNSKWAKQVPNRAKRLSERIKCLDSKA